MYKPNAPKYDFQITNIQSTVCVVANGFALPLDEIARALNPLSKLKRGFAALVLHANFGIHGTTCMVFKRGILVVIGSKSQRHAMYVSHLYRLMLASVSLRVFDARAGAFEWKPYPYVTQFRNFEINNVCAKASADNYINIPELAAANPGMMQYEPGLFSGCRACLPNKNNFNIKSSLFDSGNFTITGCKSVEMVSDMHKIIIKWAKKYQTDAKPLPRNQRYKNRIKENTEKGLRAVGVDVNNITNTKTTYGLKDVLPLLTPRQVKHKLTSAPILVQAFVTKNEGLVKHLYGMEKKFVLESIEYLENQTELTDFSKCVLEFLKLGQR